jgi:hypothetical protein
VTSLPPYPGNDGLLARVRKLLAMAEDPACTPGEAEAFNAKAAALIAKYGVDQAMLAVRDPAVDPVGDRVVTIDPPYARDKAGLLAAVASPMRCRVVHLERRSLARSHLFGHAADLERVELLFTSLLVQAAHGLAASPVPFGEHPAAYRRSWLVGYSQAVSARLWTAEKDATAETPGAELVLVDRTDLVERRRDDTYPKLAKMPPRRLQGSGRVRGYRAGEQAHLGDREVSGS